MKDLCVGNCLCEFLDQKRLWSPFACSERFSLLITFFWEKKPSGVDEGRLQIKFYWSGAGVDWAVTQGLAADIKGKFQNISENSFFLQNISNISGDFVFLVKRPLSSHNFSHWPQLWIQSVLYCSFQWIYSKLQDHFIPSDI